ncbi:transcription antitermination protein NusB [Candidatus Hepatoplasma crinochetorum Av]|uniref:Transcription antitermination protein NusB n=1 Tax=Candidatus Hepatoplasma crinochetorum Av TaxID=1427984 RepID=W8GEV7_9MOLU|nr:transcription antitermination factor NusB [Candidatus Hepatoplasma crinochetorum]AHK22324.1 transcription antitermination protein NusB [Candidatus Hepatoplasma crinochetorum Av]
MNSELNNCSIRDKKIYFFYKQFLFENKKKEMIEDLYQNFSEYNFSEKAEQEIFKIIENFQEIENKVIKALPDDWRWTRINNLEKAILFYSIAEMFIFNQKKAIAIDNAIEFAKKYCDVKTYRLINLILDKIEI